MHKKREHTNVDEGGRAMVPPLYNVTQRPDRNVEKENIFDKIMAIYMLHRKRLKTSKESLIYVYVKKIMCASWYSLYNNSSMSSHSLTHSLFEFLSFDYDQQ